MKPKLIFLILSLVEFAIGFSNARPNVFFYLGLPIGAILFGLFLIAQVLEKESALYDEQNRASESATRSAGIQKRRKPSIQKEVAQHPVLTSAHSS